MSIFSSIKDAVARYADVYIRLFKVNAIGKTSGLLAYIMFAMICLLLMFCVMLLLGFGLVEAFCAMGLAKVAAFFVTIGIFILLLIIILSLRNAITRFFAGTFIRILTAGDKEDNND